MNIEFHVRGDNIPFSRLNLCFLPPVGMQIEGPGQVFYTVASVEARVFVRENLTTGNIEAHSTEYVVALTTPRGIPRAPR